MLGRCHAAMGQHELSAAAFEAAKAKKKTAAPRHDLPQFFRVSLLRTDGRALRTAWRALPTDSHALATDCSPGYGLHALATDCTPWLRTDTPWVRNCAFCEKNFGQKVLKFS